MVVPLPLNLGHWSHWNLVLKKVKFITVVLPVDHMMAQEPSGDTQFFFSKLFSSQLCP